MCTVKRGLLRNAEKWNPFQEILVRIESFVAKFQIISFLLVGVCEEGSKWRDCNYSRMSLTYFKQEP